MRTGEIGPRTLVEHNRRIAATRHGWPPGALETCEDLDEKHRPWITYWMSAHLEQPAGWMASRNDVSLRGADEMRRGSDGVPRPPVVFGATVAELEDRIMAIDGRIEAECPWKREHWRGWLRGVGG